jgi:hypothetical protein
MLLVFTVKTRPAASSGNPSDTRSLDHELNCKTLGFIPASTEEPLRGVGPGSGRDPRERLQDFVIVSRDDQYQTKSQLSILT